MTAYASTSRPFGPQPFLGVRDKPDALCHFCLNRIRWAPIAQRWWHLNDGRYACGDFGHLAEVWATPAHDQKLVPGVDYEEGCCDNCGRKEKHTVEEWAVCYESMVGPPQMEEIE